MEKQRIKLFCCSYYATCYWCKEKKLLWNTPEGGLKSWATINDIFIVSWVYFLQLYTCSWIWHELWYFNILMSWFWWISLSPHFVLLVNIYEKFIAHIKYVYICRYYNGNNCLPRCIKWCISATAVPCLSNMFLLTL